MEQLTYFILFALGLIIIIKGSDWFLDSTVWAAEIFNIPHIIIGATIVSICTTLPETFVSVSAALQGETDMAIGNAIGSIACNTGLIMGILILFARPIIKHPRQFRANSAWLIGSIVFTWIAGYIFGEINRIVGLILLAFLAIYIILNVYISMNRIDGSNDYESIPAIEEENDTSVKTVIKRVLLFIIGIIMVVWGSDLLVVNGIAIAKILNVPSILIAVTFTALGTSLPELVTTVSSIRKGVSNIGVGNILGASILNIILVAGLSATITPIDFSRDKSILLFQIPMALLIVICSIVSGYKGKRGIARSNGTLLLALYAIFIIANILRENTPIIGNLLF